MTTSRRHSTKPIVVEVQPDKVKSNFAPSSPPSPTAKRVSFAASGDKVSRPLSSTEAWSLYHFENHARQCPQCYNPLEVYRRGDRLCDNGRGLAADVACHVFHKGDDIFSTRKDDSKLVRVEIPHGYTQLRGLLKAMDRELRSHRTAPILSYDRSYPISARKTYEPEGEPESVIVEPATSRRSRNKPSRYATVVVDDEGVEEITGPVKAPTLPARRGTLYEKDMQRKEKNYRVEIREPSERKERRRRDSDSRRKSAVYYYD